MPAEPKAYFSGLALSRSISSRRLLAGTLGCTSSTSCPFALRAARQSARGSSLRGHSRSRPIQSRSRRCRIDFAGWPRSCAMRHKSTASRSPHNPRGMRYCKIAISFHGGSVSTKTLQEGRMFSARLIDCRIGALSGLRPSFDTWRLSRGTAGSGHKRRSCRAMSTSSSFGSTTATPPADRPVFLARCPARSRSPCS